MREPIPRQPSGFGAGSWCDISPSSGLGVSLGRAPSSSLGGSAELRQVGHRLDRVAEREHRAPAVRPGSWGPEVWAGWSLPDDVYAGQAAKDDVQTNLNVVGSRYKRVEHRVRGPSVRSGAAERPKSTVRVDLHMCFAVDHVQDQPVRPDDERSALDRFDEREKALGDPVRAGHGFVAVG